MGRTLPDGSPTRGFDPRRGYSMVTLDVEGVTGLPVTPPKFLERPTGFEPATSSLGSIFDATACVTRPENWRTKRSLRRVMTRGVPRDPKGWSLGWSLGGLDEVEPRLWLDLFNPLDDVQDFADTLQLVS